jgi:hypothetical protein
MIDIYKKHPAYESVAFVASARADKKERRVVLYKIYIDAENVVAANGHILFMVSNKWEFAPGIYDYVKVGPEIKLIPVNAEDAQPYPQYKNVIPEISDNTHDNFAGYTGNAERYSKLFAELGKRGVCINYAYALKLPDECWTVYTKKEDAKNSPLVLKTDAYTAVIMPIRW